MCILCTNRIKKLEVPFSKNFHTYKSIYLKESFHLFFHPSFRSLIHSIRIFL